MSHPRSAPRGRTAAVALAVWFVGTFVLFQVGPYRAVTARAVPAALPETQPGYAPADLPGFLERLGPEGRAEYARFQLFDLANPVLMVIAWTIAGLWLAGRLAPNRPAARWGVALPLLSGTGDVLENVLLLRAIARFPESVPAATWLPALTGLKLGLFLLTVAGVAVGSVAVALRARRGGT